MFAEHKDSNTGKKSDDEQANGQCKKFTIPLIRKKMNSVQRNVKNYKMSQPTDKSLLNHPKEPPISGYSVSLINKWNYSPDSSLQDRKTSHYVKYTPFMSSETEQRISMLGHMEQQYERLKRNVNNKQPYLSKFSKPMHQRQHSETMIDAHSPISIRSQDMQNKLKKSIIMQNGKKYFADLYLMKKNRDRTYQELKRGMQPHDQENQTKQQKFIVEQRVKEIHDKKQKMIRNKGLNWNVYYNMLGLSKAEKQHLRNHTTKFIDEYCSN